MVLLKILLSILVVALILNLCSHMMYKVNLVTKIKLLFLNKKFEKENKDELESERSKKRIERNIYYSSSDEEIYKVYKTQMICWIVSIIALVIEIILILLQTYLEF